ncbi:MAG: ATP-binding protein [Oligoflexia bacterium]|nr:ATP-binding protein [Oligoflexia bacterium]
MAEQLSLLDPVPSPLDARERRKRRRELIAIAFLGVLFVVLTIAEFRLTKLSTTLPFVNSIFFFGLLNINIILLIAMVWLVARNIGKLFLERRREVLGSRLKTKLVVSFLAFSIIPTLVLFAISALYINSSFDKWFSLKIQNTLQASLEITRTYYRNTDQTAMHFAEHLAAGIGKRITAEALAEAERLAFTRPMHQWIAAFLSSQRELLALDAVEFYPDPLEERYLDEREQQGSPGPGFYPRLPLDRLDKAFAGEQVSVIQHVGAGDLIRCLVPVRAASHADRPIVGVVVVNAYIPVSLVNKVDEIASVFDDYKDINPLKYPMKRTYLVILIMITLVLIIVAIWVGLYMARELTVPVERLVHGAQAVGGGNLDITITPSGQDEIAVLVQSFNKMTRDLRENRERLVQAGADLERRRLQLEAVLGNIGTGVVAVDSRGRITTFNQAASRLLRLRSEQVLSQAYPEALQGETLPLAEAIRRAFGHLTTPSAVIEATQWNFRDGESMRVLSVLVTPLRESETDWGVVAVIDDLTHLIKGQREMAWREVARRIAHEIKNPLTPIKLSAQRLQRRLGDFRGRDGALLQECTETIIRHTDELKEMVNEFSNFARFPEVSPAPHELNAALGEVVALYRQAHGEIDFRVSAESKLPVFEFDRDQIKRVLINLLDNAVAALKNAQKASRPAVQISTHYNEQLRMAVIEVEDNGPGMSEEVRNRVFEPYFSTKKEGTGLGLAIAKRIVNDHDGFIRVHSTPGDGTRFLIELPVTAKHPKGV